MCDSDCKNTSCPFAFTEESEIIQNYGCLPTPYEIKNMRVNHGKTWACHSDRNKPCSGAMKWLKENQLPYKIIDSIFLDEVSNWHLFVN
jgi:hypothetical protein